MALETLNGLWAHVISCKASCAWFMMVIFWKNKFSSCSRSLQKFSSTVWTWWCPSWTSTTLSAWWPTASAWCGSCPTGLWGTSGPQTSSGRPCQPSARRVTELPSASGNHHHPPACKPHQFPAASGLPYPSKLAPWTPRPLPEDQHLGTTASCTWSHLRPPDPPKSSGITFFSLLYLIRGFPVAAKNIQKPIGNLS